MDIVDYINEVDRSNREQDAEPHQIMRTAQKAPM